MLLLENIFLALNGLKSNKSRSILTMLGIIIGIAAVIAIMTIGNSMSNSMTSEMESMGANQITVGVSEKSSDSMGGFGMMFMGGPSRNMSDSDLISDKMLEKTQDNFGDRIKAIGLSESVGSGTAKEGSKYAYVDVVGNNQGSMESADLEILAGNTFGSREYQDGRKVALVSDYFVNNMFAGDTSKAIGQKISVVLNKRYYTYEVIGVYKYDDSSYGFSSKSEEDTTTKLYIPLATAKAQTHNNSGYSQVTIIASSGADATQLSDDIVNYINGKFYRSNSHYEVTSFTMQSIIEQMNSMLGTISLAISFIAGISLLVGGIGVMNIMLVSITERTREIGTRKALGATNSSIRTQFIVESIVLCCVGGLIGIIIGIIIGFIACKAMKYDGSVSALSIIFSFAFSAAIGTFFGYYPANKAAKMNPIDALRYE